MSKSEKKHHHPVKHPGGGGTSGNGSGSGSGNGSSSTPAGQPVFGQPTPSPDPPRLSKIRSPTKVSRTRQEFSLYRSRRAAAVQNPILTLADVYGAQGATITQTIQNSGQIVFHSVGDTGSVTGPETQSLVADKLVSELH